MKAKVCAPRTHHDFGLKAENMKRSKESHNHFDNTEMQECFLKLKELVPNLQTEDDKKLSKVQVLQGVIDYILELELTLDFDPLEAARNLYKHQCQQERKPLTENKSNMVSTNFKISPLKYALLRIIVMKISQYIMYGYFSVVGSYDRCV